jgi:membrane fusion protein (multidrug efflux system)
MLSFGSARLLFLLIGAALAVSLSSCKRKQPSTDPPAAEVSAIRVQPQTIDILVDVPGRTTAVRMAEIRPQVNGVILKRMFEEGSDVTVGQQLYQIDPAPYEAAYGKAEGTLFHDQATLVDAQAHAARYSTLSRDTWVSKEQNDQAIAAAGEAAGSVKVDQAALKDAAINLTYTKVLSPLAGRIGRSAVTEGALVTANQAGTLATVTQLDPIYVDITQSSADLLPMRRRLRNKNLNAGDNDAPPVDLTLEDGKPYGVQGKLAFSEVSVDESTGTMTLRAVFPNPDHLLLPGMYVHAILHEGTDENAYLVPQNAVGRNVHADPYVLVVNKKDLVEERMAELDGTRGDSWVVTKGIDPGDRIITEGIQRASPGAHVHPTDATPPQTQPTTQPTTGG